MHNKRVETKYTMGGGFFLVERGWGWSWKGGGCERILMKRKACAYKRHSFSFEIFSILILHAAYVDLDLIRVKIPDVARIIEIRTIYVLRQRWQIFSNRESVVLLEFCRISISGGIVSLENCCGPFRLNPFIAAVPTPNAMGGRG